MATLCEPTTRAEELAIVKCFWREDVVPTQLKFYSCYLEFYRNEMKGLRFGFLEESFLLTRMAAQTHADLRLIVEKLSCLRNSDFSVSFAAIQDLFPNQSHEAIETSINLALRVWLNLNVRGKSESLTPRSTPVLNWEGDSSTLVNFFNRQFAFSPWRQRYGYLFAEKRTVISQRPSIWRAAKASRSEWLSPLARTSASITSSS